jgi:hypothetical protein
MKFWQLFYLLSFSILISCQTFPNRTLTRTAAEEILKPYMQEAREIHLQAVSRRPAFSDSVLVYLPDNRQITLPKLEFTFTSTGSLSDDELNFLRDYITKYRELLGDKGVAQKHVSLKLLSQIQDGDSHVIRFQQSIVRGGAKPYYTDVIGATIVAVVKNQKLVSLNSRLVEVPSLSFIFQNPGIVFNFSDKELSYFFEIIKLHPEKRANLTKYLEVTIANASNRTITFEGILNKTIPEQRELLNDIFGRLSAKSTARMLIDMAQRNQLALVKHGDTWMFQVTYYFFMPMQFDIEIPKTNKEKLKIVNFREMGSTATIKGFRSPFYPGGNKVENDPATATAVKRFGEIQNYFANTMKWNGIDGKTPGLDILVHTNNRTGGFKENAAWVAQDKVFIVGAGGEMLSQIDNSLSVLGHEYMHAILDATSGLVYRGQSGGLNEHIADVAGASIATDLENKGRFDFTMGSEIISPALRFEKEKLLSVIYEQEHYDPKDILNYNLKKVGLRHFYAPSLSLSEQISDLPSAEQVYPADCQPSVNNDNCGVHTISGIPNKATALIMAVLGFEETKRLFFRTAVFRLNQSSNFSDYLGQLYEECLVTPNLINRCDVIIASFAFVGVKFQPTAGSNQMKNLTVQGQKATNSLLAQKAYNTAILVQSNSSVSVPIKFCGQVKSKDGYIVIDDGLINPWVAIANQEVQTEGNFTGLDQSQCACVRGRVSQIVKSNGVVKSVFAHVMEWEDRGRACVQSWSAPRNNPNDQPDPIPLTFCGWVKIDSKNQNVTILDNKYNVKILKNTQHPTQGDSSEVYRNECVCVTGNLKPAIDRKDRRYNYIEQISGPGVRVRPVETCSSIRWN